MDRFRERREPRTACVQQLGSPANSPAPQGVAISPQCVIPHRRVDGVGYKAGKSDTPAGQAPLPNAPMKVS